MARRRGVRGEAVASLLDVFPVKVNFGCDKSLEAADSGGVKVDGSAMEPKLGCGLMTELGVSGYEIANGTGDCVRCDDSVLPSDLPDTLVWSRSEVGLPTGIAWEPRTSLAVAGEGVSMAAA